MLLASEDGTGMLGSVPGINVVRARLECHHIHPNFYVSLYNMTIYLLTITVRGKCNIFRLNMVDCKTNIIK